jgi:hypothetical protein
MLACMAAPTPRARAHPHGRTFRLPVKLATPRSAFEVLRQGPASVANAGHANRGCACSHPRLLKSRCSTAGAVPAYEIGIRTKARDRIAFAFRVAGDPLLTFVLLAAVKAGLGCGFECRFSLSVQGSSDTETRPRQHVSQSRRHEDRPAPSPGSSLLFCHLSSSLSPLAEAHSSAAKRPA